MLTAKDAAGPTACTVEQSALNRCLMAAYSSLPAPDTPVASLQQRVRELRGGP